MRIDDLEEREQNEEEFINFMGNVDCSLSEK